MKRATWLRHTSTRAISKSGKFYRRGRFLLRFTQPERTSSLLRTRILVVLHHIIVGFQRTKIAPVEAALLLFRIRKIVSGTRDVMIDVPVDSVVLPVHFRRKMRGKKDLQLVYRTAEQVRSPGALLIIHQCPAYSAREVVFYLNVYSMTVEALFRAVIRSFSPLPRPFSFA